MRHAMMATALLALCACNPGGSKEAAPGTSPSPGMASPGMAGTPAGGPMTSSPEDSSRGAEIKATPAALPSGFPSNDLKSRAAECAVYLGMSQQAGVFPGGHDAAAMTAAAGKWRASLITPGGMTETEAQQLVASSVNPLAATHADQRDAAAAWCVENAPK